MISLRRQACRDSESDGSPCIRDDFLFRAPLAVEASRSRDGQPGKSREAGVRAERRIAQGLVPDAARLFPGVAVESVGRQIEGAVRDAGVDMDAAVIVVGVDVLAHVIGLWIVAEHRI